MTRKHKSLEKVRERLESSFVRFLASTRGRRVAIIHDADPDGLCSAVIISKLIEAVRGRSPELVISEPERRPNKATISKLKRARISMVITTDLALDQLKNIVKSISSFARLLILDHHPLYSKTIKNGLLIKPQLFSTKEAASYCSSKLAYDFGMTVADISSFDWIAAIGIVADAGYNCWKGFVQKAAAKKRLRIGKDVWRSAFGKAANAIQSAIKYSKDGVKKCWKVVYDAKSPLEIINAFKLITKKMNDELKGHLKRFDIAVRNTPPGEIVFYDASSPLKISSTLSTIAAFRHPHRTLIVYRRADGWWDVSGRRSDKKVKVNALLDRAVRGIAQAAAGGHIPAAGARIPRRAWHRFLERLKAFSKLHERLFKV
ncbi:MAG: hypothetical protein QW559_02120 [Candidatus Woesearchaeota archaeon]